MLFTRVLPVDFLFCFFRSLLLKIFASRKYGTAKKQLSGPTLLGKGLGGRRGSPCGFVNEMLIS